MLVAGQTNRSHRVQCNIYAGTWRAVDPGQTEGVEFWHQGGMILRRQTPKLNIGAIGQLDDP